MPTESQRGMRIKVKVIPKAKHEKVETVDYGFKMYLNEPASEGRANKRLIEVLAKHFQTKKYNIKIIKGKKQREKLIEIDETP